jgi:hypothetical protein
MADIVRDKSWRPLIYRDMKGLDYALVVMQLLVITLAIPFIILTIPFYLIGKFILVPLLDKLHLWKYFDW